jgi:hypothetical protein
VTGGAGSGDGAVASGAHQQARAANSIFMGESGEGRGGPAAC